MNTSRVSALSNQLQQQHDQQQSDLQQERRPSGDLPPEVSAFNLIINSSSSSSSSSSIGGTNKVGRTSTNSVTSNVETFLNGEGRAIMDPAASMPLQQLTPSPATDATPETEGLAGGAVSASLGKLSTPRSQLKRTRSPTGRNSTSGWATPTGNAPAGGSKAGSGDSALAPTGSLPTMAAGALLSAPQLPLASGLQLPREQSFSYTLSSSNAQQQQEPQPAASEQQLRERLLLQQRRDQLHGVQQPQHFGPLPSVDRTRTYLPARQHTPGFVPGVLPPSSGHSYDMYYRSQTQPHAYQQLEQQQQQQEQLLAQLRMQRGASLPVEDAAFQRVPPPQQWVNAPKPGMGEGAGLEAYGGQVAGLMRSATSADSTGQYLYGTKHLGYVQQQQQYQQQMMLQEQHQSRYQRQPQVYPQHRLQNPQIPAEQQRQGGQPQLWAQQGTAWEQHGLGLVHGEGTGAMGQTPSIARVSDSGGFSGGAASEHGYAEQMTRPGARGPKQVDAGSHKSAPGSGIPAGRDGLHRKPGPARERAGSKASQGPVSAFLGSGGAMVASIAGALFAGAMLLMAFSGKSKCEGEACQRAPEEKQGEFVDNLEVVYHKVTPGDTICSIAGCYGAKTDDVIDFNAVDPRTRKLRNPDVIFPGEVLAVPSPRHSRRSQADFPF